MSLTDFKNNFNGGTRKNRFYVSGTFPGGQFTKFHVNATSLPKMGTFAMEYNHFGRVWKFPGEKDYEYTWNFSVIDDYDTGNDAINLWKLFQSWQNLINNHSTNKSKIISADQTYKANNIAVHHLGINGEQEGKPIKKFILNGCWPVLITPISFSMANASTFNSFTVQLQWDSIEIGNVTLPYTGSGSATPLTFGV